MPNLSSPIPASLLPADVVSLGETMVLFQPLQDGSLSYAPLFTRSIAGAESNVCIALARLGKRTRWISRLGLDPFGDFILKTVRGEGVDVSLVERDASAPTGIFFREFHANAEPVAHYYRAGSAASRLKPGDVSPLWFQGARHFHVTGITPALGQDTTETVILAMKMPREQGLTISFDPNLRRKLWDEDRARRILLSMIPLCDVFLPGIDEAEFLIGPAAIEEHAARFLEMGPGIIALKHGREGSTGFIRDACAQVPAHPVDRVVDTIGAGDAFAAGFLSILLDDPKFKAGGKPLSIETLKVALERANLMGAMAVQFRGDWEGLPTLTELEEKHRGGSVVNR